MALVFPQNPIDGQLYPNPAIAGTPQWVYGKGGWNMVSTAGNGTPINVVLDVYSLAIDTTATGSIDLTKVQTRIITNSTSAAKPVTFTNVPSGRSMAVVIEVVGNAGAISFPSGTRFAQNVDVSLASTRTFFVLFWDGTAWNVTANIKMQS